MSLRYDEIADLVRIIDASACDEFILETTELKLVIRRRGTAEAADMRGPRPDAASYPAREDTSVVKAAPQSEPEQGVAAGTEIHAPMVGTFYRAPAPDAPPFIEVGSEVAVGQPLCLIEVMKLFTTIYSEVSGRIVSICADDGEPIEYGRVLFVVEEAR